VRDTNYGVDYSAIILIEDIMKSNDISRLRVYFLSCRNLETVTSSSALSEAGHAFCSLDMEERASRSHLLRKIARGFVPMDDERGFIMMGSQRLAGENHIYGTHSMDSFP